MCSSLEIGRAARFPSVKYRKILIDRYTYYFTLWHLMYEMYFKTELYLLQKETLENMYSIIGVEHLIFN